MRNCRTVTVSSGLHSMADADSDFRLLISAMLLKSMVSSWDGPCLHWITHNLDFCRKESIRGIAGAGYGIKASRSVLVQVIILIFCVATSCSEYHSNFLDYISQFLFSGIK